MSCRLTIQDLLNKKAMNQKIVMLTAYDYPLAKAVDGPEVDMILVGDSLANVVLGLASTRDVGMAEMLHHAKAVNRAVKHALLIGDMPYEAYQKDSAYAVDNARRFIEEAGCDAVKLEWFEGCYDVARAIHEAGIPVIGHVGLTPQTADQQGGFKVQGRDAVSARKIMAQAKALEEAGCFSVVLECIPREIAARISAQTTMITIGIGAGPDCDGQVLVSHDVIGFFDDYQPKFVQHYAEINKVIRKAVESFSHDVREGRYPSDKHSFHMPEDEQNKIGSL